ncbi:MAG: hypothetical protein ABSH34_17995 [Verrucomicrobiota bacterium]|jgi:hypothetical protein
MKQNQNDLNIERRRATRHFLQVCWLPMLMVAVWAGCKQEAKVAVDANPVGTYTLVTVDGNKVPCTVQHEGTAPTIKSGTFTINADGTCSSKVVFSMPSGGDSSREVKASYTRQGSKLTMQWEGAGTTTGSVEGDTFTMNNEGMIFAYRK